MAIENRASRGAYEIQKYFFKRYLNFLNCEFLGPVCPIQLPQKKKRILKEIMLYFQKNNNISIYCVVCTHRSGNNIEYVLWTFLSENLKRTTQFPVPSSFFKRFQT